MAQHHHRRHRRDDDDVEQSASNDPVFRHEQAHLSITYATLLRLRKEAARHLERLAAEAAADKQAMGEELTVNLATDDDVLETYAEFATMNRVIDAYNISQDINAQKLSDIQLLLRQPYFAKVSLQFKPHEEPRDIYIGNAGISDDDYKRIIVDWRSPVAETYYNQSNGPTSYEANGRTINATLKLRRQFEIEGDRLLGYFDTTVAIQDALLLASLARKRTARMRAITATIQKEQNHVVRHADVPVLLVNGIAGSGKTSVMMQRIAYLLYRHRDTLDPREMVLLSPNPVFGHYIDQVLPDMGERNPAILTWGEFAEGLLPAKGLREERPLGLDDLARIDEAVAGLELEPGDFGDLSCDGRVLVSAASIRKIAERFGNVPAGPHRIALVREEVGRRLEARLGQMAAQESLHDELAALPLDEQMRVFREPFAPEDEQEARTLALAYLRDRYQDAFAAVERDEWLQVDRVGKRLLGETALCPMEWLYLKLAVTGLGDPAIKYVMVDEVQDYTVAQLAVLARYFRRAHFLLLGDPNQAIGEGLATFPEVHETFERYCGEVAECPLDISYRCTPGITQLFAHLAARGGPRTRFSSVQRDDEPPKVLACKEQGAYEPRLQELVREAAAKGGLCAVVVPRRREAKRVAKVLEAAGLEPLVLTDEAQLPDEGLLVVPLRLAKGLEFDHVVVPDASREVFPDDDLARRRLYTTLSRATQTLTVLARGHLSHWFSNPPKEPEEA